MIIVWTQKNGRGQFTARAETQSDVIGNNFPPVSMRVRAVFRDEEKAAQNCALKAVAVLMRHMLPVTTVRRVFGGCWKVEFRNQMAA